MTQLVVAALVWIGVHVGIAGTGLRGIIARRTGEMGFRGGFSLLSVAAILFLVTAWKAAPADDQLWITPDWLRPLLIILMLPAFVLFVGSLTTRNANRRRWRGRPDATTALRFSDHPPSDAVVVRDLGGGAYCRQW